MHQQAKFVTLEIHPIIAQTKAMQYSTGSFQFAELVQLRAHHLLRQTAEFTENLQLQFFGHARQFSGAGGCEDDLKRSHVSRESRVEGRGSRAKPLRRVKGVLEVVTFKVKKFTKQTNRGKALKVAMEYERVDS